MGRDATANKRMAAKRSREKAAGLRRMNIAVKPEVFDKLAELMKRHNCASQARLIEFLILDSPTTFQSSKVKEMRNEVTDVKTKVKRKDSSTIQLPKTQKKSSPTQSKKGKTTTVKVHKELSSTQMTLF